MYKPKVLVTAPVATRSGYGSRSRDVVRALIELDKYDVIIQPVSWGVTSHNALVVDDPKDKLIIDRIKSVEELKALQPGDLDVHIHIVVPNEFTPLAKYNIGITAGLECTTIPINWIEGMNRMNLTLASSEFSAEVLRSTQFKHSENNQIMKAENPVDVIFEGADTSIYKKTALCSEVLHNELKGIKEDFNFLFVGHWLPGGLGQDRKDVGMLVKTFMETFNASQNVGLILKTSGSTTCMMDREQMLTKIEDIKNIVKRQMPDHNIPNVYLLSADLFDTEMNDLYNHPKVKAHVSFTHGEGFGRPLLEASLSEKPIIAPNWSGHVDFLDRKYSVMIPGSLVDLAPDALQEGLRVDGQKWFQVNYKDAAMAMVDVKKNYRKYKIKSRKQAKNNRNRYSFEAMKRRLDSLLTKHLPKFTEKVQVQLPKLNLPKLEKV